MGIDPAAEARRRAAVGLLETHQVALRRAARGISLCADDADDALQRAALILLTKAPPLERRTLYAWMRVVVRREALAVRRARERALGSGAEPDWFQSRGPGPLESAERREADHDRVARLAALKPDERAAIVLQAGGYSYAEIGAMRGWTYTKVNRCLAEGRARLRVTAGSS